MFEPLTMLVRNNVFPLLLVFISVCSCKQEQKTVELENQSDVPKLTTLRSSSVQKQATSTYNLPPKNAVNISDTFVVVQPSIEGLFIHAFNREAKEKEWEAMIVGVVITTPDWEEVNDPNTQEILGRTRTAAIFAKDEEGRCIAFERYTIFQSYKNGSFIGKPRGYSYSPSKDIDCQKYEHLMFKSVKQNVFDERNE